MNKKIFLILGLLCPFSLFSISFYDEIILFSGMLYNANLSLEFDFKKIWIILVFFPSFCAYDWYDLKLNFDSF